MTGPILVVGAGGHAKVVIELLRAGGGHVAGLLDADPTPREVLGAPVLGDDARLADLRAQGLRHIFVALGDNNLRLRLGRQAQGLDYEVLNAISPDAMISPSAEIGLGVAIMAGAVINAQTLIADFAIINTGARVDHDCILGEACHIAPGTTLAGGVQVGSRAFLGAGCTVIPRTCIGEAALIGAGACVTFDIPSHTLAFGVPARVARALAAPEATP